MDKTVSIIIPTFHDWDRLQLCLQALARQTYLVELIEVLIVNNDPKDEMPEMIDLPENFIILNEGRPGSYVARNAALKLSKGEIIGFTDSDCIPDENWIKNAVAVFEEDEEISRVGGAIELFYRSGNPSKIELYDAVFAFPQKAYVKSGNAVTANMFTYRYVFDQIGMFNESLLSGGDFQWGKLANRKGYKIAYASNAIVKHPARPSFRELVIKAKRVGRGQSKFQKGKLDTPLKKIWTIINMLKPRYWEMKKIFRFQPNMGFSRKLFLIFLRHYILFIGDLERIKMSWQLNDRRTKKI